MSVKPEMPRNLWTDKQWAKHLGTSIKKIPKIRAVIKDNYSAVIVVNKNTGLYAIAIYAYEMTPSGFERPTLSSTSKKEFKKESEAIVYANEKYLPSLFLSKFAADSMKVPANAIQMLYIKER